MKWFLLTGFSRRVALLLAASLLAFAFSACAASKEPDEVPAPDLPELSAIGGVHDVWAFPFGMDANRERVRDRLGDPRTTVETHGPGEASGPRVERWHYEGVHFTFLIHEADGYEHLLGARIEGPAVPVRGGLEIGMPLDEALSLLGEPRIVDGESHVYFYRDTTIEIIAPDARVEAIQLSRAMP